MRLKTILQTALVLATLAGTTVYADSFPHPPLPIIHVSTHRHHRRRHHHKVVRHSSHRRVVHHN